ncbi:MAG: cyclic nucleotide-binding domain-containing protein, partial [Bryobacteraceae bacterium]
MQPSPAQKETTLRQVPLFSGLTAAEIHAMAQRTVERRYAPGEMLFHEGEDCAGLFLVAEGNVKVFKTSASGREVMLAMESAPSSVAEVPMFDGGPYPASVRAV